MYQSFIFRTLKSILFTVTRGFLRGLAATHLLLGFASTATGANEGATETGIAISREFKEILIDLRNSRGGNGDVGAGYLTIMDFLWRYRLQNHITLLVDDEGRKRLNYLLSDRYPLPPEVEVKTIENLDQKLRVDFYLALASPSGTLKNKPYEHINFAEDAILMVQTVLGNTENKNSINPMGLIEFKGHKLNMPPAGIGPGENGIYYDFIANFLRGRDEEFTRRFLLSELETINNSNTRQQIEMILNKSSLKGARTGLVYGVTSVDTRGMMTPYLQGLTNHPDESFCFITPSRFDLRFVEDPKLRARIEIFNQDSLLPAQAVPGKIYILLTPNLPHPVFVGLTKFAMTQGVTPIGAGDGFMSAGIQLGEPFVLTRVPWNASNIRNLKQHLLKIADSIPLSANSQPQAEFQDLMKSLYDDIDFTNALDLQNYRSIYQQLSSRIPPLSDSLLKYALAIRTLSKEGVAKVIAPKSLHSLGLSLSSSPAVPTAPVNEVQKTVNIFLESVETNPTLPQIIKDYLLNSHHEGHPNQCQKALQ